jgi:hypothetical protein
MNNIWNVKVPLIDYSGKESGLMVHLWTASHETGSKNTRTFDATSYRTKLAASEYNIL